MAPPDAEYEEDHLASEERLIDTFAFVLSFLREMGLPSSERALVSEIREKFPELKSTGTEVSDPDTDHRSRSNNTAEQSSDGNGEFAGTR
eukprot:359252-Chlamydomonas_euryale.AAC.4